MPAPTVRGKRLWPPLRHLSRVAKRRSVPGLWDFPLETPTSRLTELFRNLRMHLDSLCIHKESLHYRPAKTATGVSGALRPSRRNAIIGSCGMNDFAPVTPVTMSCSERRRPPWVLEKIHLGLLVGKSNNALMLSCHPNTPWDCHICRSVGVVLGVNGMAYTECLGHIHSLPKRVSFNGRTYTTSFPPYADRTSLHHYV